MLNQMAIDGLSMMMINQIFVLDALLTVIWWQIDGSMVDGWLIDC